MCDLQSRAGLPVVTRFAERLPVRYVPEKALVAAMRYDVIDYGRGGKRSLFEARRTERMLSQESGAGGAPAGVVPALIRATAQTVSGVLNMLCAINTVLAEVRTPWIPARSLGATRHIIASFTVVSY